ncbi:MAG TPA: CPBP family glutamic-type intramembrane protease, partial [Allocoleopsis sp.]
LFQFIGEYIIFTAIGILIVTSILRYKFKITDKKFKYKSLISSASQEFMFRSFLFQMLLQLTSNTIIIIILNTILFTIIHTIYSTKPSDIFIVSIAGLSLILLYINYPNFILITLTHTIFNYILVSNGHFVEEFQKPKRKAIQN